MTNDKIAKTFDLMAMLLTLEGANPFKIRAYERASQVIAGHPKPVQDCPKEELLQIPGIGKGICDHVEELVRTGTLKELDELRKKYPPGVLDMTQVAGVGPKRAKLLFTTLGLDSLEKLKAAAVAGKLRGLPRFGPKLEENILKGLAFAEGAPKRMLHWNAKLLIGGLIDQLKGAGPVVAAGSFRRGRETVGDIDLLCASSDGGAVIERFVKLASVARVIASGPTKATVWLSADIQCDLRVVPPQSFGAALMYFTGSKDHNVAMRERALKLGWSINEYGLFKASDKERKRPLAGRTEEEVFEKLGLAWIPPELRENRGELEAAERGLLPKLVEAGDVRGDFHNHSNYTDGTHTLEEMARAAKARGWEWVALGDHSQSLKVASGLSIDKLRSTIEEVRRIGEKVKGIRLMRSMEVDILKDGALDYPDDVLDEIDVVVGSVHSHFGMPEPEMTARMIKAVRHPGMDVLGHITGRLIGRREGYKVDEGAVLEAAAGSKTAVEINGQPDRQELGDVQARRARDLGVPIAVDTDAHSVEQLNFMEVSVNIARRAWLEKKDVVNCMTQAELKSWLASRRA